jgi:hypothetical protein
LNEEWYRWQGRLVELSLETGVTLKDVVETQHNFAVTYANPPGLSLLLRFMYDFQGIVNGS